jgi:hypothetical protein
MTKILIASPEGATIPQPRRLAAASAALQGTRIAVLDNGKPNANLLLTTIAEHVARRAGMTLGPVFAKANAASPSDAELLAKLRLSADVVLTGSGD